MMRDAYGGERYIKEKGSMYLAPTSSMRADGLAFGQNGFHAYEAYKSRAVYHELVRPALMAMLGVMHRKPPVIELPAKIDSLRKRATWNGESLHWLLQKINEQQMLIGRYGLMLDVAEGAGPITLPYIVGYNGESIINWDSSKVGDDQGLRALQLVVLNETDFERRAGLAWIEMMRYRVLAMAGEVRDIWNAAESDNTYISAEVRHTQDVAVTDFVVPSLAGNKLNAIPFVFVGCRDLVPEPDLPVLLPLARLALAIYRTEADYRQALFMQGQDTLVVVGQQADANVGKTRMGAFGSIELPIGGSAEYIGVTSDGPKHMRDSIDADLTRAAQLGAQLLTERGNEAEAAAALSIRVASRTATLTTVAQVGAAGMEQILKHAAVWTGADPDQVSVQPNLDFADDQVQAQDLVYLMTARKMGAPISKRSIHGWLARNDFTNYTYEDEMTLVDSEPPDVGMGTPGVAGIPGQAVDPVTGKPIAAPKGPPGGPPLPGKGARGSASAVKDNNPIPDSLGEQQSGRPGNKASRQRQREKDGTVGGAPAGSSGLGKQTPNAI